MLVEFNRYRRSDEDYDSTEAPAPIAIDSESVSAVFASSEADAVTIIRLSDGRGGFLVCGTYRQTMDRLTGRVSAETPAPTRAPTPPVEDEDHNEEEDL